MWVPCWRTRRTEEGCWSTWTNCRSTLPRFGCKNFLKNEIKIRNFPESEEAVGTLTSSDIARSLQMNARFKEIESQAAERISEMETQLMQATKETELLKVSEVPQQARRSPWCHFVRWH